jgi:hypothetical protein
LKTVLEKLIVTQLVKIKKVCVRETPVDPETYDLRLSA